MTKPSKEPFVSLRINHIDSQVKEHFEPIGSLCDERMGRPKSLHREDALKTALSNLISDPSTKMRSKVWRRSIVDLSLFRISYSRLFAVKVLLCFSVGGHSNSPAVSNRVAGRIIRIVVAFVGGVVFAWLCSLEAVFGGAYLMNWLHSWIAIAPDNQTDFIYRGKLGDLYVQFAWVGLVLAAGVSFALFTLEPGRKLPVIFYGTLLILLLPLSVANYCTIDFWVERIRQAIFDVLLVLLGLAAIQRLLTYNVSSVLGGITRGLAIFLVGVYSVVIPAIYAVIWFLNASEIARNAAQAEGFRPNWISTAAFVVSAAFTLLTCRYRRHPQAQ
ncbi:MAG TPA: hypothetical protein VHY59_02225 [Chthoniobacterales bacterium]|nr:hypothetical protein [Chthoniobacterales bacterium]